MILSQRAVMGGLLLLAACSNAATLTVGKSTGPCPNSSYSTIGAALSTAASGDIIEICPGLYPEQLTITKSVKLRGIGAGGYGRVLLQPAAITNVQNPLQSGTSFQAAISVINTTDVEIKDLAIDASLNSASGCTVSLAAIHFSNSSGTVANNAISGAQLSDPTTCTTLFPGNGFGVLVDTTTGQSGPFDVAITGNSIHQFNRNGILVNGAGISATISDNTISGIGPSTGYNQFGVFIALGAVANISHNLINQANCGSIDLTTCMNLRSEGIVFRAAGDGSVADSNIITNVQSGIFLNGATHAQVSNNVIMSVDALDGIDIQGTASGVFTGSIISGNKISHVFPISGQRCGIFEAPNTGVSRNLIFENRVDDAYCGVAFVSADNNFSNVYSNTLYTELNIDQYPNGLPQPTEP
jgi:hypothetical protein